MLVVAAPTCHYNRRDKGGAMQADTFQDKQKELLTAAAESVAEWPHPEHPFQQIAPLRTYEQAFVVRDYYRPSGYVWKQGLDKSLREKRAVELRGLDTKSLNFHHLVAYFGLLYRLTSFSSDNIQALQDIRMPKGWTANDVDDAELLRRQSTSFDLLQLQHVVRGWQSLAANAEFLLEQQWPTPRLKSLSADMAVQARYEHVRPKIFRNIIKAADIDPAKAAAALAESAVGACGAAGSHYQALIAAMEGDLDRAVGLHCKAPITGYRTQFMRTAAQVEPVQTFAARSFSKDNWPQQPVWDVQDSQQKSCSLVACDEGYFYQYFAGFAESFALQNPGGLLHFHGVGFKPSSAAILERIDGLGIEVNVSHDKQDLSALLPDRFKGYCAGARYMYLPFFLQHYDRIIIHDVDGVLTTDMESIWANSDADIMISSLMLGAKRRAYFALWSNIGAGAFAIRRSEGGIAFANALSGYLAEQFTVSDHDERRYFFSDQTGLLLATLAFRDKVAIEKMPQIFEQSTQHSGPGRDKAKKQAQAAALKSLRSDTR